MTQRELKSLACELSALSVFRNIRNTEPISLLIRFLACEGSAQEKMDLFGGFVYSVSCKGSTFSDFLRRAVCEDENAYVIGVAHQKELHEALLNNVRAELNLFSRLTRLDAKALCEGIDYDGHIPEFEQEAVDFEKLYAERLANISRCGYGIFSGAKMFRVSDGAIVPVRVADEVALDSFIGYEEERRRVLDNTRALIEGRPAANVLLYGDAGTGKSSTVKACANYFYDQGVRLIELRKDQLFSLSHIMGEIAENPLKFIIFIDDLSFNKNDDCFSMLKAALEGSASAKAKNAVIYATSNRRHIVKESFSDRAVSDDIHHSDTVQELMSLSDRFGLVVYFSKPNKALYLDIVHRLAEKQNISMEKEKLDIQAEAFALKRGSRSPRAAEQFINSLIE